MNCDKQYIILYVWQFTVTLSLTLHNTRNSPHAFTTRLHLTLCMFHIAYTASRLDVVWWKARLTQTDSNSNTMHVDSSPLYFRDSTFDFVFHIVYTQHHNVALNKGFTNKRQQHYRQLPVNLLLHSISICLPSTTTLLWWSTCTFTKKRQGNTTMDVWQFYFRFDNTMLMYCIPFNFDLPLLKLFKISV